MLATLLGNGAGAQGAPPALVVDAEPQPTLRGSGIEPGQRLRRIRVVEPTVKAGRAASLEVQAFEPADLVVEAPTVSGP